MEDKYNNLFFAVEKPEFTNRNIRIPVPLMEQLQQIAQEENVSINFLVNQCIEFSLKHRKPKIEKQKEQK